MRVAVIGGGVVGLSCARFLSRAGAEVLVIERDRCGQATSLGNAGWVTPALSAPLPAPGVIGQALRWMIKGDSPLLIHPRLDPDLIMWCWRFWRSSAARAYRNGMEALVALNSRTLELYDGLLDEGVEFEMHCDGVLFALQSGASLRGYTEMFRELKEAGYSGEFELYDAAALREREPALSDGVVGGLYARDERHVRPESLTKGLVRALAAEGVELIENEDVQAMVPEAKGGWRIQGSSRELTADRVVIAAGVWSVALLSQLGVKIAMQAAKGYSVTAVGHGTQPSHALYLTEAKVGCSPFGNSMRIAGTLELAGIDLTVQRRRLDALLRVALTYFRDWTVGEVELEWAGLRPLAPDGLPLIGAVPTLKNLYLASGHGMLGITLALATANALTPLVMENRLVPELVPFRIDRR